MRAIILAAGQGTRLSPYTLDRPKCLVELAGRPLLAWQLDALRHVGVNEITVVIGYRGERIAAQGLAVRHNPDYARTNMVQSLMCAADLLDGSDDVLIAYADIVYEPRVVRALAACGEPICTTVDRSWLRLWSIRTATPLAEAETLTLDARGNIVELGKKPTSYEEIQAQYMGLIQVRADLAPRLPEIHRRLDPRARYDGQDLDNMYMTSFLQHLIDRGQPVRAVAVDGGWLEVDSASDLELYNRLHAEGRLGGYCDLTFGSQATL